MTEFSFVGELFKKSSIFSADIRNYKSDDTDTECGSNL